MPTIVHFEIPGDDPNRAKDFYTALFGWKIEEALRMEYWMISPAEQRQ